MESSSDQSPSTTTTTSMMVGSTTTDSVIPTSPPPSYEHVLEETRKAAEQQSICRESSDNIINENSEDHCHCMDGSGYTSSSNSSGALNNAHYHDDDGNCGNCDGNGDTCAQHASSGDDRDNMENNYVYERVVPVQGPVTIHKSSKEFYKAVAKQLGITCKMSDQCRCLDCQSHYFECEYEENEQEKTDGGLGAGTPMFISEVMHGSACHIL